MSPESPSRPRRRATAAAGGMTEAAFQREVLALAGFYRWRAYHTHDSRRSNPGFPDLVLVRPPRLIFAELKTDTGRLRREQAGWLEDLRQVGDAVRDAVMREPGAALGPDAMPGRGLDRPGAPRVEVYLWRPGDLQAIADTLAGAGMDPEAGAAWARERRDP